MLDSLINIAFVIFLLYTCYLLWKISNSKHENKLLIRVVSLFILVHLIIFPIIYVVIINNDINSIEIDNRILSYEKEVKLKDLKSNYKTYDLKNQIRIIDDILKTEIDKIKKAEFSWEDEVELGENVMVGFMYLKNYTLTIQTRYREITIDPFGQFVMIYPNEGYKTFEINTQDFDKELENILRDYLNELKGKYKEMSNKLDNIQSNKFWTYKQILPYTVNILFTDNFKPKSKLSNVVHFIHNIIVVCFLLGLIVSLSQNYLTKK